MKSKHILAAILFAPLFLAIAHAKEKQAEKVADKKPSLTYYYFDG
jgi:hypothetical protein